MDTAAKRRSAMRRYLTPRPAPDNVFDQADAQDSLWQYRGNLFGAVVVPPLVVPVAIVFDVSRPVAEVT